MLDCAGAAIGRNSTMQQWQYCMLGPIKQGGVGAPFGGYYPALVYFKVDGPETRKIEAPAQMKESEVLSQVVAQLGLNGWEMVGAGAVAGRFGSVGATYDEGFHFLYFKRLME